MKIETKKIKGFNPFEVSIQFETLDDVELILHILKGSNYIPIIVDPNSFYEGNLTPFALLGFKILKEIEIQEVELNKYNKYLKYEYTNRTSTESETI